MDVVAVKGHQHLRLLVCGILVLVMGSAITVYCWIMYPPTLDARLLFIMVGAAFSELYRLALPKYALSLSYPLAMAAAMLGGPAAACLTAAVVSVSVDDIRDRIPGPVMAYNAGMLLLGSGAGGLAYVYAGGRVLLLDGGEYLPLGVQDFPAALIAMAAAATVSWMVNMLLTALGVYLYRGLSVGSVLVEGLQIAPSQFALAFVGFLMAQVLAIAAVALPLFVFPLVVARGLHQRSTVLRETYSDTVRSLIGALEAKDSYTRGHSVRVAQYAAAIGVEMGFLEAELERLEYAALLHDLGKLSLSSGLLTKPSTLTDIEAAAMGNHPAAGADMVNRIPPLRHLTEHIGAHHEWYDGRGYPAGLAGDAIPKLARVLSVADAFDAMTTNRAYRPAMSEEEALGELLAGRGGQFDPMVVDAFLASRSKATLQRSEASSVSELASTQTASRA